MANVIARNTPRLFLLGLTSWVMLAQNIAITAHAQAAPSPATAPSTMPIKVQALQADVDILQSRYEALHPGLYRYNSKDQIANTFASLRKEFESDRSLEEAFVAISRTLATIRCGHSQINPYNLREDVRRQLCDRSRVPFCFRWIGSRMIVTRPLPDSAALHRGDEIVSIDGIATHAILQKLMTITRADGANDAKRIAQLQVAGDNPYATFDLYFPLMFPVGQTLSLSVRSPNDAVERAVTVKASTQSDREALIAANYTAKRGSADPLWTFQQVSPKIALLKMESWAVFDSKWDWKQFLNEGMDRLANDKVDALVIDLRGNEGGADCGNEILSHLVQKQIAISGYERFARYRSIPSDLRKHLQTWDKSFRDWGEFAQPAGDLFFRMTKFDDSPAGDVIAPFGKRFEGRVIVLIDATNSSATFQFADVVQRQHLGTLVGQTTGGNHRGINGGAFFFIELPGSGLEVDLPLIGQFPKGEPLPDGKTVPFEKIRDRGVSPDVAVEPTVNDIATGRDAELETALDLLKTH